MLNNVANFGIVFGLLNFVCMYYYKMKKVFFVFALIFLLICNGQAQLNVLYNFYDTNGASPCGALTPGASGKLYGMTSLGGSVSFNWGCIFSMDTNGNKYKRLFSFNYTNGLYPRGGLTLQGNKLFGMLSEGGTIQLGLHFFN